MLINITVSNSTEGTSSGALPKYENFSGNGLGTSSWNHGSSLPDAEKILKDSLNPLENVQSPRGEFVEVPGFDPNSQETKTMLDHVKKNIISRKETPEEKIARFQSEIKTLTDQTTGTNDLSAKKATKLKIKALNGQIENLKLAQFKKTKSINQTQKSLDEKQKNEKLDGIEKVRAHRILQQGFVFSEAKLDLFLNKNIDITKYEEDSLAYGENFHKINEDVMAARHIEKRLNSAKIMLDYVDQKKEYLKDCTFPELPEKNQFRACKYVVPPSAINSNHIPINFARAHISIINKIALKKTDVSELQRLDGQIKINGKDSSLDKFFNICDITPKTLNEIDAFVENEIRLDFIKLLEKVRTTSSTPLECIKTITALHLKSLGHLTTKINNNHFSQDERKYCENLIKNTGQSQIYIGQMVEKLKTIYFSLLKNDPQVFQRKLG